MADYNERIPESSLTWYENGQLIKNPQYSANMEVFRTGVNENYIDIQKILEIIPTLAPSDSVEGEVQARIEADEKLQQQINLCALKTEIPTKLSQLTNDAQYVTKTYVDNITSTFTSQISAINEDLKNKLVVENIKQGARITITTSGNNVTINANVDDLLNSINEIKNTELPKKLEAESILAGNNITVEKTESGKVKINSTASGGSSVEVSDTTSITMEKSGETISASAKISSASGNGLKLMPDGLYSSGGSSEAKYVSVEDAGNYFTTSTVEGNLQEIGLALNGINEALETQRVVVE